MENKTFPLNKAFKQLALQFMPEQSMTEQSPTRQPAAEKLLAQPSTEKSTMELSTQRSMTKRSATEESATELSATELSADESSSNETSPTKESATQKPHAWELYVDGAARNNPGPAGAGLYLLKDGVPVEQQGMYLGVKTNNQAEYIALLLGIYYAQLHMGKRDTLVIKSDSELMVRQIRGTYAIKNRELARIYGTIRTLLETLHYSIVHIPREQNKVADKLANMGIDKKIEVPQELLLVWPVYEDAQ